MDEQDVRDLNCCSEYHGDLREHIARSNEIAEPLIEKPGLKEGVPAQWDDRRSGTAG
jgi:hypothetical protein